MTDGDLSALWHAGIAVEPIGTDDPQVAQHFVGLRTRAAELPASLVRLARLVGEGRT